LGKHNFEFQYRIIENTLAKKKFSKYPCERNTHYNTITTTY